MKFFKNFLLFLLWVGIFVVALTSFSTSTLAQETQAPDPATDPSIQTDVPAPDDPQEGAIFTTVPALEDIDELTPYVDVTFHNLGDDDYVLCTGSNYCLMGDDSTTAQIPTLVLKGKTKSISKSDSPVGVDGTMTIRVCGDKLQVKICKDGKGNWFHGGNFYAFSIGVINGGMYYPIKRAAFYVGLSYPTIVMSPSKSITTNNTITMTITAAKKNGGSTNNNYQIVNFGPGVKNEQCGTVTSTSSLKFGNLKPGKYTFYVNEQINDTGGVTKIGNDLKQVGENQAGLNIGLDNPGADVVNSVKNTILGAGKTIIDVGKGAADIVGGTDDCQGGFTYYKIVCTVTLPDAKGGSCTDPEKGKDPDGSEYTRYLKQMAALNKVGALNPLPCSDPVNTQNPANCKKINTAVGQIDVTPQGFINSIFRFVLLIASFGGIIIIIYAGYVFMVSRGDKEKLAGARETLTSAIVGLLFIVLSIVILEIIGVDILRIPGFSR